MPDTHHHMKRRLLKLLITLIVLVIVAYGAMKLDIFGMKGDTVVEPAQTPSVENTTAEATESVAPSDAPADESESAQENDQVEVTDLSIHEGLPEEWLNVLLLGSDERTEGDRARTDTIIICSINTNTGEVKLSSILRDTAVQFKGIDKLPGFYRINAANYYGGERLLMKTLNEALDLNIEYYVHVNFYGFQQLVEALGGIETDITESEQEVINQRIVEQAYWAWKNGFEEDKENIPYRYLEEYGHNVHLDGRMTLAYARLRQIDNDYARSERQRTVLTKLLEKLKKLGAAELLNLGTTAMQYVETNLSLDRILSVALAVCSEQNGLQNAETMRLPLNESYVQEKRNGEDMLYDTDWAQNAAALHHFIYAQ